MTAFIDLYTESGTFLHRMDPRVKIVAVATLSLLALIMSHLVYLLVLAAVMVVLILLGRASFQKSMLAFGYVFRVMALIVVLWPIFNPGGTPVVFELGPIRITEPGIMAGIATAVRIFCLAASWYLLMFTTSQRDLVRGLVKMGLRFDFGLSLAIALRFLPTFSAIVESIKDAQRARGMELDKGNLRKRARDYVAVLVPTIITALKMADMLSLALQSRAYGARADRTYVRELKMRAGDYVALSIAVAVFAVPATAKYIFSIPL
ncbi:MAG: energy-coupling factor transporter transmembrane protein EcfT [Candidatus Thermoplasmatota archaeon]|nr:energy-coupling factor transporter transmembrane protein EcfT [Candidatus Thermoplasmatota archaeon]